MNFIARDTWDRLGEITKEMIEVAVKAEANGALAMVVVNNPDAEGVVFKIMSGGIQGLDQHTVDTFSTALRDHMMKVDFGYTEDDVGKE